MSEKLLIQTNGITRFNEKADNSIVDIALTEDLVSESLYKNPQIESPVSHAFADKFILVRGTIGNEKEQKIIDKWFTVFRQIWQLRYHVACQYKDDINITESDINSSHLVLIGDQNTNRVYKQVIDQLPVKIESEKIILRDREYMGDKLNINLIYPNPLNKKKYIVIITANNLEYLALCEPELSLRGWYDYSIWHNDHGEKSQKIVDGLFNEVWKQDYKQLLTLYQEFITPFS
jgi:hypothetical protein